MKTARCEHRLGESAAETNDVALSRVAPRHKICLPPRRSPHRKLLLQRSSSQVHGKQAVPGSQAPGPIEQIRNGNELVPRVGGNAMDANVGVVVGAQQVKPDVWREGPEALFIAHHRPYERQMTVVRMVYFRMTVLTALKWSSMSSNGCSSRSKTGRASLCLPLPPCWAERPAAACGATRSLKARACGPSLGLRSLENLRCFSQSCRVKGGFRDLLRIAHDR